jgi:hypothetical protein
MHTLKVPAIWGALAVCGVAAMAVLPVASPAQEGKTPAPAVEETEEEKKEREVRKVCAVALCAVFHKREPATGEVTCSVQKTWRKDMLTKIMSRGKLSWPWGDARCATELKFDRATLVKAMQGSEFEAQFEPHAIRCELDREKDKYEVKMQIHPRVTFKEGKAVKANLNWGKVDAPLLAKSAIWSATAADNTFGVLQAIAVEDINEFIHGKCMEVKEEWQGK